MKNSTNLFKKFKAKHNNVPNIVDFSKYSEEPGFLRKSAQMREDDLKLLDEFRSRRTMNTPFATKPVMSGDRIEEHASHNM